METFQNQQEMQNEYNNELDKTTNYIQETINNKKEQLISQLKQSQNNIENNNDSSIENDILINSKKEEINDLTDTFKHLQNELKENQNKLNSICALTDGYATPMMA